MFSRGRKGGDDFDVDSNSIDKAAISNLVCEEVVLDCKEDEILKEKRLVEKKIIAIQRSTRVSMPMFAFWHNALRMRFKWYYAWHLSPWANFIHWLILVCYTATVVVLMVSVLFTNTFSEQAPPVYASDASKVWSVANNNFTDFSLVDTQNDAGAVKLAAAAPSVLNIDDNYIASDEVAAVTPGNGMNFTLNAAGLQKLNYAITNSLPFQIGFKGSDEAIHQLRWNTSTLLLRINGAVSGGYWDGLVGSSGVVGYRSADTSYVRYNLGYGTFCGSNPSDGYVLRTYASFDTTGLDAAASAIATIVTSGNPANAYESPDTVHAVVLVDEWPDMSSNEQLFAALGTTNVYSSGYASSGTADTSSYDSGAADTTWNSAAWVNGGYTGGTPIRARVRAANTVEGLAGATFSSYVSSSGGTFTGILGRYAEVEIALATDDTSQTPILESFTLNYTTPAAVPAAPTNAGIMSPLETAFTVGWTDNSSDETGFKVYVAAATPDCADATYPGTPDYTPAANATSQIVSSKSVNTRYCAKIVATNTAGDSTASYSTPVYTLANVPAAPTISNVSSASLKVIINPNSNPANTLFVIQVVEGSNLNYLQTDGALSASPVFDTYTNFGGASGVTNTGLAPDTTYTYTVYARNGDAATTESSASTSLSTTSVPTAPSAAVISNIGTTTFGLTWSDDSSNETGFKVYISTVANADCSLATYSGTPDYTPAADAETQAVSSKSINTQYCAKVVATNAAGDSTASYSAPVYTLANVPSAPTVSTPTSVSLKVIINSNSNPANTTFAIKVVQGATTNYVKIDGTNSATPVFDTYTNFGGASGVTNMGL
ncbi:MAG: fibronectin type III domain-containing protein, partial [bacterium]